MARLYDTLLAERGWPLTKIPDGMDPVLVRYPVRVADKAAAVKAAQDRRLELGTWFDCPLHQVTEPLEVFDYAPGACPIGEKAAREVVNLPTHPRVNERMARQMVDLVCEVGPAR
jgi:dTDP-4-amino-4,6-dideoxygalactose transaminase